MLRTLLVATSFLVVASPSFAEVRSVHEGESLQAAINAARPGDEIRLAPGATFTGNFVLPVVQGTASSPSAPTSPMRRFPLRTSG